MRAGKVIGRVWSTKKLEQLPAGTLLRIQTESNAEVIIAFDSLGCGEGEDVLIATGSVANKYFAGTDSLVDAVVIGSLDKTTSK